MKAIGFEEQSETLELNSFEVHHMLFIEDTLSQLVQKRGGGIQQKPKVAEENRFLANTSFPKNEADIKQQFSEDKLAEMKYCDALDKLVEFRNQLMSEAPKNRRLRIYHKKHEVKNVQVQQVNFEEEFSKSDDQIIAGYWKQVMVNNAKSQQFQSKRKM